MKQILYFFLFVILPYQAKALVLDLNTLYYSDQLTLSSPSTVSRLEWDLGIGFDVKKAHIFALSYGSFSATDTISSTTTTFVTTDMGFRYGYFFSNRKTWLFTITYNLISKAAYNNGTTNVELRGTSLKADMGYNFWIGDYSALALKIFYYAPSFTEEVNTTTLTKVSYSRAVIYPGLNLFYMF